MDREFVKYKFPNISEFEIYQNTESTIYNCISYSIGRKDVWSWSKKADPTVFSTILGTVKSQDLKQATQPVHTIQDLKIEATKTSKNLLILSGVSLVSSGFLNMVANNQQIPTTQKEVNSYAKNQKNLHNASSVLVIVSGLSLSIGISITIGDGLKGLHTEGKLFN